MKLGHFNAGSPQSMTEFKTLTLGLEAGASCWLLTSLLTGSDLDLLEDFSSNSKYLILSITVHVFI